MAEELISRRWRRQVHDILEVGGDAHPAAHVVNAFIVILIFLNAVAFAAEPGEQRVFRQRLNLVPPHMRDLQRTVARFDGDDLAADPAKALGRLEFASAPRHQLHADANPEKRAPSHHHCFVQGGF